MQDERAKDIGKDLEHALLNVTADLTGPLGVAVSGGSDSMALLHVAVRALGAASVRAITVDHDLREGSRAEAEFVSDTAKRLGVAHDIVTWDTWDGQGNLSDRARRARYALIATWAKAHGIAGVCVAHTADDQAETFLMRLARRSGLSGLAGMPASRQINGFGLLRPFLGVRRETLRDYLRARAETWADDPSNDDPAYERVRMRQALPELDALGLGVDVLSDVARQLAEARAVVDQVAHDFLTAHVRLDAGDVLIDKKAFFAVMPEIRRRVLDHALKWVASARYGPRATALAGALAQIERDRDTVLHGCLLQSAGGSLRITREFKAVAEHEVSAHSIWDGRWKLEHPQPANGLTIRALGVAGLKDCPDWRTTGHPRAVLLASPSVWSHERLIAAPVAGYSNGWKAGLVAGTREFYRSILSR